MRYLVEIYLPWRDGALADAAARAAAAAEALASEGRSIRYVDSVFVREDETCFLLFEAGSAEQAAEAASQAGIAFERVLEAETGPQFP